MTCSRPKGHNTMALTGRIWTLAGTFESIWPLIRRICNFLYAFFGPFNLVLFDFTFFATRKSKQLDETTEYARFLLSWLTNAKSHVHKFFFWLFLRGFRPLFFVSVSGVFRCSRWIFIIVRFCACVRGRVTRSFCVILSENVRRSGPK